MLRRQPRFLISHTAHIPSIGEACELHLTIRPKVGLLPHQTPCLSLLKHHNTFPLIFLVPLLFLYQACFPNRSHTEFFKSVCQSPHFLLTFLQWIFLTCRTDPELSLVSTSPGYFGSWLTYHFLFTHYITFVLLFLIFIELF